MTKKQREARKLIKPFNTIGETRTKQSEAHESNINTIMEKTKMFGYQGQTNEHGYFADVSQAGDFQKSMDTINLVNSSFNELPAATRKRFGNDPTLVYEFVHDEDNFEEGIKLGLIQKRPETAPIIVKMAPEKAKPKASPPPTGNPPKGDSGGEAS